MAHTQRQLWSRPGGAETGDMAIDLQEQWFRGLTELRYAATPKRLRALLGVSFPGTPSHRRTCAWS